MLPTSIHHLYIFSCEALAHTLVSVPAVAVELCPYPIPQLSLIWDIQFLTCLRSFSKVSLGSLFSALAVTGLKLLWTLTPVCTPPVTAHFPLLRGFGLSAGWFF